MRSKGSSHVTQDGLGFYHSLGQGCAEGEDRECWMDSAGTGLHLEAP